MNFITNRSKIIKMPIQKGRIIYSYPIDTDQTTPQSFNSNNNEIDIT